MKFGRIAKRSSSGSTSPRRTGLGMVDPAGKKYSFSSERNGSTRQLHMPENFDIQIIFCSRLYFI